MNTLRGRWHALYDAIPGKPRLMNALRSRVRLPERVYRHLHFRGVFEVEVGGRHLRLVHHGHQVENSIFWSGLTGDWEGASLALWTRLCANARVVFDVGANTGVYALVAKTLAPDAQVYAFEPVTRVFQKLVENCRLNDFDIVCEELALSDHDGTATIFDTAADHTYSVTVNRNMLPAGVEAVETTIPIATLDGYLARKGIASIDLMKIDVETHEAELLAGFREHLPRMRPTMLIEVLSDELGRRVEEAVGGLGYLYYAIDERSGPQRRRSIRRGPGMNFLLCMPQVAQGLDLDR